MKKIYLLATIMAIITSFAVYFFVTDLQKSSKNNTEIPTTPVVVAVDKILPNTIITLEMVRVDQIPSSAVTPGTARDAEEIVGKIAVYPITAGMQIVTESLSSPGSSKGTDLSYQLGKDERAISISVDEITGISGFIRAGDLVDIATTETIDDEIKTHYLLKDVRVLKLSNKTANLGGANINSYSSIILCVSSDDALTIASALDLGLSMRLVLQPIPDIEAADVTEK